MVVCLGQFQIQFTGGVKLGFPMHGESVMVVDSVIAEPQDEGIILTELKRRSAHGTYRLFRIKTFCFEPHLKRWPLPSSR